ncbi:hypothetical protein [Paenibacillus eucommiae]|uniref:Multisubunit Na+/H+ antiporter MnhE subunit n=1 Tax=Paenibacillus eucommiae TaxID=1355755 RepID=A0ABS4J946_9BACL|nr:hypothetical protein [Paenibacillus eucommiae]MBP1996366.1 multisubunit Na+/H+ antiporter MnhE subunit [Paenibacillus eucommiae]
MLPMLYYYHQYYHRSFRYVAPLAIYFIIILFIYWVVPTPVMDSYAITSTLLFIISAWLCYGFIDHEDETQQIVTFLHARSLTLLYTCKLLYIWLFTLPVSIIAMTYPILFNKFDHQPSFQEIGVAFASHELAALLGISLAAWFNQKLFKTGLMSFLGLGLVITISLAGQGIVTIMPAFLSWLIPPLRMIISLLSNYTNVSNTSLLTSLLSPLLYAIMLNVFFLVVMKRRKFESRGK